MKNIKPLGNRILVKPSVPEEVTTFGIVLPSNSEKEKKAQGTIVALGLGEGVYKSGLKLGDVVVYGKYAGDDVQVEESGKQVDYKILNVGGDKDEVLAVLE